MANTLPNYALLSVVALSMFTCACSHGNMQVPMTWLSGNVMPDADGMPSYPPESCPFDSCMWFSNYTFLPEGQQPTIGQHSRLRTFMDPTPCVNATPGPQCDWTKDKPWRAPGTAAVFSPCGVVGANPFGCIDTGLSPHGAPGIACTTDDGGFAFGTDGRALGGNGITTNWAQGSVVEAAWSLHSNHGGGYSYRLCKKPTSANYSEVTEECFQKLPLNFVGNTSFIHFTNGSGRYEIDAMFTSEGTFPPGSMWAKNPVPALGHGPVPWQPADGTTQFSTPTLHGKPVPALAGIKGYAGDLGGWAFKDFLILDKLQVPAGLEIGDYVLSFRWDCEHTPQVWNMCASIRVVPANLPVPTPEPVLRCGDDAHGCCMRMDNSTGVCLTWAAPGVCTETKEHCENGRKNEGAPEDPSHIFHQGYGGCHGIWRVGGTPYDRCDDRGSKHACGVPCGHDEHSATCFASVGPCTASQDACASCNGTWLASLPAPPPSPPAPSPTPSPGGCPGGSLTACIDLCPSNPVAFQSCVNSCQATCRGMLI